MRQKQLHSKKQREILQKAGIRLVPEKLLSFPYRKGDLTIYLHSFHKRFTSYQNSLALCFCQRKWFSLRCWLNYSRKVFLWGNKMLHITISHHIGKNTQRKIIHPWFCSKDFFVCMIKQNYKNPFVYKILGHKMDMMIWYLKQTVRSQNFWCARKE